MAFENDHLVFCLATVTINTIMAPEENHLDFFLDTVTTNI